jgi:hypothetical protein
MHVIIKYSNFYGDGEQLSTPRPTAKLEDHLLSSATAYLIYSDMKTRHAVVTEISLSRVIFH